eukprot:5937990-Alexandrium_andersonii.AAC.1
MHGGGNRSVSVIPRLHEVALEVPRRHDSAVPAGHVVEAGREGGVRSTGGRRRPRSAGGPWGRSAGQP